MALTTSAREPPTCSNCQRQLVEVYSKTDPNYATFNPHTGKYEWDSNPEQASFYCEECDKPLGEEEIIVRESLA
ncbi:MAG TPA: hypothetical protein VIH83_02090 [Candidatus Bathyarchaeia archaeon]